VEEISSPDIKIDCSTEEATHDLEALYSSKLLEVFELVKTC
jgi:hypothetical protein